MEFEAKKTLKALFVFSGFLISGVVLLILGFVLKKIVWIFGAVFATVALCFIIDYLFQPGTLLKYDGKTLTLESKVVSKKSISAVYCKPFKLNRAEFDWGTLYLTYNGEKRRYGYVKDCRTVAQRLIDLTNERP